MLHIEEMYQKRFVNLSLAAINDLQNNSSDEISLDIFFLRSYKFSYKILYIWITSNIHSISKGYSVEDYVSWSMHWQPIHYFTSQIKDSFTICQLEEDLGTDWILAGGSGIYLFNQNIFMRVIYLGSISVFTMY